MKILLLIYSLLFIMICSGEKVFSADLNWTGTYRLEGLSLANPNISTNGQDKTYFLHHFVLQPRIVASDQIQIFGRFDILNGGGFSGGQFGQFFGQSPFDTSAGCTPSVNCDAVRAQAQNVSELQVNHLFIHWIQSYGMFIAGRAPMHFGLGMTHNSGAGKFDHWLDTRDMLAYKLSLGNLFFMPMYSKVRENLTNQEDDINTFSFQIQYEDLETNFSIGALYEIQKTTVAGNDATPNTGSGGFGDNPSTRTGDWSAKLFNFFVKKGFGDFDFGLEVGMESGDTGVLNSTNAEVTLDGLAAIGELNWKASSSWAFGLKAGFVSGDDQATTGSFESYFLDRNYDLGLILFNHPLGALDFTGSRFWMGGSTSSVDTDAVTNAFYFAPGAKWFFSETMSLDTRLIYATLNESPAFANGGTSLGVEWDLGLSYKPYERFEFGTEFGILFPGNAFEVPGSGTNTAWGIVTKAAVSF